MYSSKISSRVQFFFKPSAKVPVRAVDTFESCGYELNHFGHIRNDFAVLNDSQNLLDYQRAVARMQEITDNQPDNSNRTFEEIVREVRPRWCQTPAELDRFEQYLIDNELDYYNSLKANVTEAGATIDLDDGGEPSPVAGTKVS